MEQDISFKRAVVAQAYKAQYSEPIDMRAGNTVKLGERDSDYVGWIWCTHSDGRAGWAPESFLSINGSVGRALRDYCAVELSVSPGEVVELGEVQLGWVWATNTQGESGWLPIDNLNVESLTSTLEVNPNGDAA